MKRKPPSIYDAAKPFRDAFTYDPGHSDLDNEQPIHITVTLGDWRKLDFALMERRINAVGMSPTGDELSAFGDGFEAALSTISEREGGTAEKCNAAMVFKKDWANADPRGLEPWYSHWVGELTAQGLHSKQDIATVLAILSKRLAK